MIIPMCVFTQFSFLSHSIFFKYYYLNDLISHFNHQILRIMAGSSKKKKKVRSFFYLKSSTIIPENTSVILVKRHEDIKVNIFFTSF